MAEKIRSEKITQQKMPASPAPSRSQTNQQSRPPESQVQRVTGVAAANPPASAKPPPEDESAGRRRGDIASVSAEFQFSDYRTSGDFRSEADENQPEGNHRRRARTIAGSALLILICVPIWSSVQRHWAGRARETSELTIEVSKELKPARELPPDGDSAMAAALEHLNAALEQIPGQSPEQILKLVSKPDRDCMLAWTNDLPSVVFGKEPILPNSLANTLEACADAVTQLASKSDQ